MGSVDSQRKDHSFSKRSRLLHSAQFRPIFNGAAFIAASPSFLILANPSDRPRLGLVVAKKHFKLAVTRNRIKRMVRESFRQYPFEQSFDLVVMARPGLNADSNASIAKAIEKQWRRLKPAKQKRTKR